MDVKFINPFVSSTTNAFSTMLGWDLDRGEISLNDNFQPEHDVSGIIGLSGRMAGTVVVSLERTLALKATESMLGEKVSEINADVIDTVGELTNIIAGQAKGKLEEYQMSLALPMVITGRNHHIDFASTVSPISIPFDSEFGPLTVEVGLAEA